MTVISLTTDFGNINGFVGTMKGVIWSIAPHAQIADITHDIPPQDIRQGALALWRASPFFPPGTVHIAVIDPGVGTNRRPLGFQLCDQFYVVPDNGLITPLLEAAESSSSTIDIVHLDKPEYWLPHISKTFHGRDIFAPCGAHLAAGIPLSKLGGRIKEIVRKPLPRPTKTTNGFAAHILLADVFGNLTTNLPALAVIDQPNLQFIINGTKIDGLVPSYGHRSPGELVALVDSEGYIEIAQVNGSAALALKAKIDDMVEVRIG